MTVKRKIPGRLAGWGARRTRRANFFWRSTGELKIALLNLPLHLISKWFPHVLRHLTLQPPAKTAPLIFAFFGLICTHMICLTPLFLHHFLAHTFVPSAKLLLLLLLSCVVVVLGRLLPLFFCRLQGFIVFNFGKYFIKMKFNFFLVCKALIGGSLFKVASTFGGAWAFAKRVKRPVFLRLFSFVPFLHFAADLASVVVSTLRFYTDMLSRMKKVS